MSKNYAVRNISLCTKDCLCLYVCPTGASDTENSIIDKDKCIGCMACANACPSKAISMMPRQLPIQQTHSDSVVSAMYSLLHSKSQQENIASSISGKFAKAIATSNRIMAEDIIREAGFMLPQSANSRVFLEMLLAEYADDLEVVAVVKQLLDKLQTNESMPTPATTKWRCSICQHVHTGATPPDKCPICSQPASVFVPAE